ncbi:MAG TPA: deoxyguanosinetriphosphate triphosphohydrolase [Spirochaetota bacterium]|nr:deoxyguanosinetriphosphate triphosphohydrolase [Spirochaetota bacterium]HNT12045.1 deoxyguanosinetriphosphate triphosphohydrolase [Spirochaetota bacterium]
MIPAGREFLQDREDDILAPYAAKSKHTRGRRHAEESHPYRTEFQRDRDRIIHSRAFRRLEYKTQVFVNHEGDHYRTRLTHTIEVAQISRSIARALRLNEDLTESIALAHDLGHTPFGHAGERELNELLRDTGGFEHNRQSLRVVETLEERYHGFSGLNLTWETREGIIKHSSYYDHPEVSTYAPEEQPSIEAQIIDFADEIAYNNHDLDDGISSGLIDPASLDDLGLWRLAAGLPYAGDVKDEKLVVNRMIRSIINILVTDLIQTTLAAIAELGVATYDDVKRAPRKLVGFSAGIAAMSDELKRFLRKNMYQHYRVVRMTIKAQRVVRELFNLYREHPNALPDDYFARVPADGLALTIADYIAGMTDRYALEEHQKLTDPMIRV